MPGTPFCRAGARVRKRAPKMIQHRTDSPKWGGAPQRIIQHALAGSILAQKRPRLAARRRHRA
ncbi:hypothetical protein CBM2587_B60435 [Cupriavidus taiwanensis]|uniref:Uncharacterized protein n=1 Tax=Cupriavidus taiwanensis TaxID=164546 RepID=A0A375C666_9BURK|nr:hypothetical protein CBM2587_B60435 [Cupriavidus taiwanensis]